MCYYCESNGWRRKQCNLCKNPVYISICIDTGDEESGFPYSQTELCKECWDEYGINVAFEHIERCRQ